MLNDALNFFIDIIFPPVCAKCGKLNKNWICNNCYKNLKKLKIVNNKNINYYFNNNLKYNNDNNIKKNTDEINFDKFLYLFNYNGIIRKLIIDYKFNNRAYISNLFTKIILKDYKLSRKITNHHRNHTKRHMWVEKRECIL